MNDRSKSQLMAEWLVDAIEQCISDGVVAAQRDYDNLRNMDSREIVGAKFIAMNGVMATMYATAFIAFIRSGDEIDLDRLEKTYRKNVIDEGMKQAHEYIEDELNNV